MQWFGQQVLIIGKLLYEFFCSGGYWATSFDGRRREILQGTGFQSKSEGSICANFDEVFSYFCNLWSSNLCLLDLLSLCTHLRVACICLIFLVCRMGDHVAARNCNFCGHCISFSLLKFVACLTLECMAGLGLGILTGRSLHLAWSRRPMKKSKSILYRLCFIFGIFCTYQKKNIWNLL